MAEPSRVSNERNPVQEEVERYIMEHSGQRNGNWTRDCGCVLRAWADEMMIEHGWSCVRDVDSLKLQKWFYNKTRTLKVSAVVSIFKVSKWCGHRVDVCEEHLIPADKEIEVGLERRRQRSLPRKLLRAAR